MWLIFEWMKTQTLSPRSPCQSAHNNIIITNMHCVFFFNYPTVSWMTGCPSAVAKSGSAVCALCKTGFKERVHNGIRPCYLADRPRLCWAVVQMLAVCFWETVGIFFLWLPSALKPSLSPRCMKSCSRLWMCCLPLTLLCFGSYYSYINNYNIIILITSMRGK